MKVLAGPTLSNCVFYGAGTLSSKSTPQDPQDDDDTASFGTSSTFDEAAARPGHWRSLAEMSDDAVPKAAPPVGPVEVHEERAMKLVYEHKLVPALAELEGALCLSAKEYQQRYQDPQYRRRRGEEHDPRSAAEELCARWRQLVASAVSWSFDLLADASLWSEAVAAGDAATLQAGDQALEMLCLAEMLTRQDVAETFKAVGTPDHLFFRALVHAGLGTYYRLRRKPQAALRFLTLAADGNARWVHPAVLLNLSAAHLHCQDPDAALSQLNRAVLAFRSATGQLSGDSLQEVDKACQAAELAVRVVLGLFSPEDAMGRATAAPSRSQQRSSTGASVGRRPQPLSLSDDEDAHSVGSSMPSPGGFKLGLSTSTPDGASSGAFASVRSMGPSGAGGAIFGDDTPRERSKQGCSSSGDRGSGNAKTSGLGMRSTGGGFIAAAPPVMSRRIDNAEVGAAHTLLSAKVLLYPWPEFSEHEAVDGDESVNFQSDSLPATTRSRSMEEPIYALLKPQASAGIARHAARLKSSWTKWGQVMPIIDAPGGGLVLRESLLLCFLQAVLIMRHCCLPALFHRWLMPVLYEGLALAIVLFGHKQPLALRLISAYRRLADESAPHKPQPPKAPAKPTPVVPKNKRPPDANQQRPPSGGGDPGRRHEPRLRDRSSLIPLAMQEVLNFAQGDTEAVSLKKIGYGWIGKGGVNPPRWVERFEETPPTPTRKEDSATIPRLVTSHLTRMTYKTLNRKPLLAGKRRDPAPDAFLVARAAEEFPEVANVKLFFECAKRGVGRPGAIEAQRRRAGGRPPPKATSVASSRSPSRGGSVSPSPSLRHIRPASAQPTFGYGVARAFTNSRRAAAPPAPGALPAAGARRAPSTSAPATPRSRSSAGSSVERHWPHHPRRRQGARSWMPEPVLGARRAAGGDYHFPSAPASPLS